MANTILYIDDDPDDRRFVEKILTRLGYALIVADDGEAGVARAAAERPALILVDIQMPGLDGMATARRLRALESCAQTPIIALTAYAEQFERAAYLEAGFTDYQQKQAGIAPLVALVRRHIGE